MIDLLTKEFTEEQFKRYIINVYMFLNFNPTTDFPVSLYHVFRDLGFANKGNALKTIKSNFTKELDYKIILVPREKKQNAGRPEEEIMLNIDTYKTLCMLVKTPQGKMIRRYYVKLENIYNKIVKMEIETTKTLLEMKDKVIEQIQVERITDKKLEKHMILVNMLKDKKCIYLIELSANLIKIGSSCQIDIRKDRIQAVFGGEGIFLDVFECDDFRDIERNILRDIIIQENKYKNKLETGHTSNEVVLLSDNFTYNQLVNIVEKHIDMNNKNNVSFTPSQILEKRKLDVIESLINNGESLSNIINLLNTPINPINTINQTQQKVIETKPLMNITTFKPNRGRAIQQIDPNNLTRIVKLYKNMETLMEDKKYDSFSETGVRTAIKNNTIYKKYRWMILDDDPNINQLIVHNIQPTVQSKKSGCSVVLELNNDKSIINTHFISINVASQELKMSSSSIKKMITLKKLYNNHYYIYLDDALPELLDTYHTKVFKYVPKCAIKIKCINPETKEEKIFPSLQHAREFCKVHHKTLHKAIKEKKLLNGFFWELV